MSIQRKPVNYLNNADMLKEIHLSKNSYSVFEQPEYHQYDVIIDRDTNLQHDNNVSLIFDPQIQLMAKTARANRSSVRGGVVVSPDDIPLTDCIFRVMTWEHIPLVPRVAKKTQRKKTAKEIFEFEEDEVVSFEDLEDPQLSAEMGMTDQSHIRVNFPPFQHWQITEHNTARCIGRSHWRGNLVTGEFSKDHGQITPKLAKMYLMLCERYAMRYNWRGYTYNDEMRGSAILQLTYVGLRFNEAKSNNPFAYYTAAINNSFCRVLNTEKRNQNIRDDILELNGLAPSWSRQYSSSGTYEE